MSHKSMEVIPSEVTEWYDNAFFDPSGIPDENLFVFAKNRALYCTARFGFHHDLNNDWNCSEHYLPSSFVRGWVSKNRFIVMKYLLNKEWTDIK